MVRWSTVKLTQPFLLAFLGTVLLAGLRLSIRFTEPLLWGEDGADLFTTIFCERRLGLFKPVVEQLMPLQRVIAWLCLWISPYYFAELTTLFSLVIFSCCSAYIAKNSFRVFIRNDGMRLTFALLIPIFPGSFEILGNLNCLTYPMTWLLCLVIFELALAGPTYGRIIAAASLIIVDPVAFTTIPLLLALWKKINNPAKYLIVILGMSFLLISVHQSSRLTLDASHLRISRLSEIPETIVGTLVGYALLLPFLGESIANKLISQGSLVAISAGCLFLSGLIYLARQTSAPNWQVLLGWSIPMTYCAAHTLSRQYSIDPLTLGQIPSNSRCLFLFFAASALVAFSICQPIVNRISLNLVFSFIPLTFLLMSLMPQIIHGGRLNYGTYDPSWNYFRSYLGSSNTEDVWQSGFNIYPAEVRNDGVYSWASLQVSSGSESITCKFSGGNTGDWLVVNKRD